MFLVKFYVVFICYVLANFSCGNSLDFLEVWLFPTGRLFLNSGFILICVLCIPSYSVEEIIQVDFSLPIQIKPVLIISRMV